MTAADNTEVLDRIRTVIHPILNSLGLELVDVQHASGGGRSIVRIFIDKDGGVTLRDCEDASVYLGHALDVEDPISSPYTLEVSSPGLDRPLKRLEDFVKSKGRRVRVKLKEPLAGQWVVVGQLIDLDAESLIVELETGQSHCISMDQVHSARLELQW